MVADSIGVKVRRETQPLGGIGENCKLQIRVRLGSMRWFEGVENAQT